MTCGHAPIVRLTAKRRSISGATICGPCSTSAASAHLGHRALDGGHDRDRVRGRFPERVEALVLADTAAEFDDTIRSAWRERAAIARREGMAPLVEPTVLRWFPEAFRNAAPSVLDGVRATIGAMDPEHYAAAGEALSRLQLTGRLAAIRARTLVCAGAEDVAIPPRFSEQLQDGIAGAQLHLWPGVGHAPPLQIPAAFAADVLTFLRA